MHIGKDAFVGAHALLLTNVRVGEGSVVGGGAVISRDTEPWSINVLPRTVNIGTREKVRHPDN
ncbi:DapH/DapD/GlmU-related protein [Jhaorihella thermophila]|uniref:DapH/DapD/GlmU-related protein n=1 Tax=Jhaorihella thermophila TaxID=488547 RepID=UPI000CDE75AB